MLMRPNRRPTACRAKAIYRSAPLIDFVVAQSSCCRLRLSKSFSFVSRLQGELFQSKVYRGLTRYGLVTERGLSVVLLGNLDRGMGNSHFKRAVLNQFDRLQSR